MAIGRDMRLTSPELCEAAIQARARRRQRRRRDRARGHGDALLRGLRARLRGRPDRHRLAQPGAVQRHEDRAPRRAARGRRRRHRQGARPRARGRVPTPARTRRSAARATCCRASPRAASRIVDVDAIAPLQVVLDGANGMAGTMMEPILAAPADPGRALPLRARRHVPALPAEPAARGEPRSSSSARCKRTGADLGIAWDGDADRCFFVDDDRASSCPATSSRR